MGIPFIYLFLSRHLRDKLISNDRLKFAIDIATKCNILPDPAWLAWGLSLLSLGKYAEAREKFKYCLGIGLISFPSSLVLLGLPGSPGLLLAILQRHLRNLRKIRNLETAA